MSQKLIQVENYQVKESKSGHKVPVVNEVHLHSIYSPLREAETIVNQFKNNLEGKSSVLVLGLAFGYHVQELITYLESQNIYEFEILVLEPNKTVLRDCMELNPISDSRIQIISEEDIDTLYSDKRVIDFLLKKPAVIPHSPSFSLYKDYFKSYLTYKASNRVDDIQAKLEQQSIALYLEQYDGTQSFEDCLAEAAQKRRFDNDYDFAMLAFTKLCEQIQTMN